MVETHHKSSLIDIINKYADEEIENFYYCTAYINQRGLKEVYKNLDADEYHIVFNEVRGNSGLNISKKSDIKLYQYKGDDFLHAKFGIIEFSGNKNKVSFAGSSNLTKAGIRENRELNISFKGRSWGKDDASRIHARFTRIKDDYTKPVDKLPESYSSRNEKVQKSSETVDNPVIANFDNKIVVDETALTDEHDLVKALERYFTVDKKANDTTIYKLTPDSTYREGRNNKEYKDVIDNFLGNWNIIRRFQKRIVRIQDESVGQYGYKISYDGGDESDVFQDLIEKIQELSHNSQTPIGGRESGSGVAKKYIKSPNDPDRETLGHSSKYLDEVIEEYGGVVLIREFDEGLGEDKEIRWSPNNSLEEKNGSVLYNYQEDWVKIFTENNASRYEIEGPCGSGKTLAAIRIMSEISQKSLVICPTIDVCEQWNDALISNTNLKQKNICKMYDSIDGVEESKKNSTIVTISTYDKASSEAEKIPDDLGLIVYDESHSLRANKWSRAVTEIPADRKLGLSATSLNSLEGEDESYGFKKMGDNWNKILQEAVGETIAKPKVYKYVPDNGLKDGNHTDGFNKYKGTKVSQVKEIVDNELDEDRSVLVFVEEIENHGEPLKRELNCDFVNGNDSLKERSKIYKNFENGNIKVLVVTGVADEGLNIPNADTAVMASWIGSSQVQGTQRIGRVMRSQNGQKSGPRAIFAPVTNTENEKMNDQVKQAINMKLIKQVHSYEDELL